MKGKAYKKIEEKIKTFLGCTDTTIHDIRTKQHKLITHYSISRRNLKMRIFQKELTIKEIIEFAYEIGSITWDEYDCLWKYVTKESEKLVECCRMLEQELTESVN